MTEANIERLVPAGSDALDDLTVAELDIASRQLGCDVVEAFAGSDGKGLRWGAFARVAWLWAKRRDPHAKLQPYLELRPSELYDALGITDDDDQGAGQDDAENPTDTTHA